ncbi:MAG: hypothetical protein ACLFPG_09345 [Desulfohalobiaceae bacterium]
MANVNFSVPQEIRDAFDAVFAGRNKSAIIAELMQHAIQEEEIRQRQKKAAGRILSRWQQRRPLSEPEIQAARQELRK